MNQNEYNKLKSYANGLLKSVKSNPRLKSYIAEKNSKLLGYAVVENIKNKNKNVRLLNLLVTLPEGGVGKKIINRIKQNSKNKNIIKLQSVQSAVGFYKKMRFNVSTPKNYNYSKNNYVFMNYKIK